jgi:hypothetical protein
LYVVYSMLCCMGRQKDFSVQLNSVADSLEVRG